MSAPTMAPTRERPILFSGEMVRAILDGRKTQTRRVVTPENSEFGAWGAKFWKFADLSRAFVDGIGSGSEYLHVPARDGSETIEALMTGVVDRLRCRMAPARCWEQTPDPSEGYVPPASRLWVREAWRTDSDSAVYYEADEGYSDGLSRLRPSIHMPRWASRITLEITNVRVERLQDITPDDCQAEGIDNPCGYYCDERVGHVDHNGTVNSYAKLWDSLNAKRGYGWDVNPWVWVLEFKRVAAEVPHG